MNNSYLYRQSFIHELPAGIKIFILLFGSTVLFSINHLIFIFIIFAGMMCLYFMAKFSPQIILSQLRPALWILGILFIFHWITHTIHFAAIVALRFITLFLLASWVTLTLRVSEMIAAIEKGLIWLRWFGVNPAKISFGISLAFRFIPLVITITQEVREAQRARGLENNILALALPVIIRTLKMADDITHAIEARSYDP